MKPCNAASHKSPEFDKQTTNRLLSIVTRADTGVLNAGNTIHEDELPMPSERSLNQLNEKATSRLVQIVRLSNISTYNQAEVAAVEELLNKNAQAVTR